MSEAKHAPPCPECHHRPSMRDGDPAYCYCPCHDVADAARDLLAACQAAAAALEESGLTGELRSVRRLDAILHCRSAIARATGKEA